MMTRSSFFKAVRVIQILTGIMMPVMFVKVFFVDKSNFPWHFALIFIWFLSSIIRKFDKENPAPIVSAAHIKTVTALAISGAVVALLAYFH